jgi:hypothetical protein
MYYGTPPIVTNGLVVFIDAASNLSYISGSTTVRDLSGNGKNGTRSGGTGFSPENGGIFTFDGVNDTISFGTGNTFFPLNSFTIDLWFQSKGTVPVTGTSPGLFGFTYGIRLFPQTTRLEYTVTSASVGYSLTTNDSINYRDNGNWYNVTCQTDATSSQIYVNGQFKNSRAVNWLGDTIWPTNTWNIGRDNNNVNYYLTGSIASYKMYNRILTPQEIAQNYNALKSRFGLQ